MSRPSLGVIRLVNVVIKYNKKTLTVRQHRERIDQRVQSGHNTDQQGKRPPSSAYIMTAAPSHYSPSTVPTGQRCTVGLSLMTSKSKGLSQATPIGFRQGRWLLPGAVKK